MKNFGEQYLYKAHTICSEKGAKLPFPQNNQANSDTYAALKGKVSI